MKLEIYETDDRAAQEAAAFIAREVLQALESRGRFCFAVSGGRTPELMLQALAQHRLPWGQIHLFQVDERIAPAGDKSRNAVQLSRALLSQVPLPDANVHLMPVELSDPEVAATTYEETLIRVLGTERQLDLVHLGLGSDGHTASLVPGDPLNQDPGEVGISQMYQGHRRMSLLGAPLSRARSRLWLVTGEEKKEALSKLLRGDSGIPASALAREHSLLIADASATADLAGQAD